MFRLIAILIAVVGCCGCSRPSDTPATQPRDVQQQARADLDRLRARIFGESIPLVGKLDSNYFTNEISHFMGLEKFEGDCSPEIIRAYKFLDFLAFQKRYLEAMAASASLTK